MSTINPFNIVKANEFSDDQIIDYWVSLSNSDDEFFAPLNPRELMPKYVLGTKGCGKTHLLRYYSFDARLKYYKNDIKELLNKDGYLASYSRLDSISSTRFSKSNDEEAWRDLYNYYFELVQSLVCLDIYERVLNELKTSREIIFQSISAIINQVGINLDDVSLTGLKSYLNQKRIAIDKEIIDYAFTRKLNWSDVKPEFVFGSLIFEIPRCFSKYIQELSQVNYIYVLDEYEKLKCDWQKESLNSLVYEKKYNTTFWVGARKVGYTTRNTLSGEPIHEGHEFDPVDLDTILKNDEKGFQEFAIKLFKKRLEINGIFDERVDHIFEKYNESKLVEKLQSKGSSLKHWKNFESRLASIGISDTEIRILRESMFADVRDNPIDQKIKLYAFYLLWANEKSKVNRAVIGALIDSTNKAYIKYKEGANRKFKELYNKFRKDMIAQLAVENNEVLYQYSGFADIVKLSDCNPRVFLTLLKLIIEDCHFRGIYPFKNNELVPVRSQYIGINETAKWFLNDIEVYGKEREYLDMSMNNLLNYLYVSRFSDKPVETSLCAFYYRQKEGQANINKVIQLALQEAFLLEVPNKRKDKTLGTPQKSYQVNRLIAALYGLPIARRGVASMPSAMITAIFDHEYFDQFDSLLTIHKSKLNAPFKEIFKSMEDNKIQSEPTLF